MCADQAGNAPDEPVFAFRLSTFQKISKQIAWAAHAAAYLKIHCSDDVEAQLLLAEWDDAKKEE